METICHVVWMFKPAFVNMYIINSRQLLTFLTSLSLSLAILS